MLIMLYGFPFFCNAPQLLLKQFLRVERRAAKFFDYEFQSLLSVADNACKRLFNNVLKHETHSLRCMFESRDPTKRNSCVLKAPFARTSRFSNSFIKYANA